MPALLRLPFACLVAVVVFVAGAGGAGEPAVPVAETMADRRLAELVDRTDRLFSEAADLGADEAARALAGKAQGLADGYESYVHDFPRSAPGWVAYARFLQRSGRVEEAWALYKRAHDLDPRIATVNHQLGHWFALEHRRGEALLCYLRAVELAPDEAVYHFDLGRFLAEERGVLLALGVLDARRLDSTLLAAFRRAAELSPDRGDFWFRWAEAHADVDPVDWSAVERAWREIELRGGWTDLQAQGIRLHRARALVELGRPDEARELLKGVIHPALEASRQTVVERLRPSP